LGQTILVVLFVAVLATWPLIFDLGGLLYRPVSDPDVQVGLWWPRAFWMSVLNGSDPFFASNLNWPSGQNLNLLLWNGGAQVFLAPALLFQDPVVALNVGAFWILLANGLTLAWLGWTVGKTRTAQLFGAVWGVCGGAYSIAEATSGRPEQALIAPIALVLIGLHEMHRNPSDKRNWILCGIGLALTGSVYWFYAYFLVILTAPIFIMHPPLRRGLVASSSIAIFTAIPALMVVLFGFYEQPNLYGHVLESQPSNFTSSASVLFPSALLGGLWPGPIDPARWFSAIMVPVLVWVAFTGRGLVRAFALMGLAAAVFAIGPRLQVLNAQSLVVGGKALAMPAELLNFLPGFTRFWWPYRWLGVAVVATGASLAWAFRNRPILAASLCLIMVVESMLMLRGNGHKEPYVSIEVPSCLEMIRDMGKPGPIFQIPDSSIVNGGVGWAAWHQQPINTGVGWHLNPIRTEQGVTNLQETIETKRGFRSRWTLEQTRGFHFVLLWRDYAEPDFEIQVEQVLGEPFFKDNLLSCWSLPGISEPPKINPG